jgi:hypothetical protein
MRINWRGARGLGQEECREDSDFSFNQGRRGTAGTRERGCHVSAVMQGNCVLACGSFHSGECHKSRW